MSLTDELERLQSLHDSGTLTDAEFADAKAKVLADDRLQTAAPSDPSVQQDLHRLQLQSELLRLDQDWATDREDYMLRGRYGSRVVPTSGGSIGGAIFVSLMGVIPNVIGANVPHMGLYVIPGIVLILAGIWGGVSGSSKADAYNAAYSDYQAKRNALNLQLADLG